MHRADAEYKTFNNQQTQKNTCCTVHTQRNLLTGRAIYLLHNSQFCDTDNNLGSIVISQTSVRVQLHTHVAT